MQQQARSAFEMTYRDYINAHPSFAATLEPARSEASGLLKRVVRASDRNARRFLIAKFLRSPQVKLLYLFRSVCKKKLLSSFAPELLRLEAHTLNAFDHDPEPVSFYNTPPSVTRRSRPLTIFGPRKHALQNMVSAVLQAIHPSRPDQYTINGGVPEALKALERDFHEGYVYATEHDISDFYRSIQLEGLARLLRPLPRGVVENVIWNRRSDGPLGSDVQSTGVSHHGLLPPGGLPQGSASSPIAAEIVVASLLADMPTNVRYRTYADNVIILGRTRDDVEAASVELDRLATALDAGPLGLKRPSNEIDLATYNFQLLGYAGLFRPREPAPRIEWMPKDDKLNAIEAIIESDGSTFRDLIEALKWVQTAPTSYSLWQGGTLWSAQAQCALHARLAYRATNSLARTQHCRIIYNYWRDTPELPREIQLLLPVGSPLEESGRLAVIATLKPWVQATFPLEGLGVPPDTIGAS